MLHADIVTHALLIHQNRVTSSVQMVSHDVINTKGGFTLGAGTLLDAAQEEKIISIFNQSESYKPKILDDSILCYSASTICWWKKAGVREMRFRQDDNNYLDLMVPYPAMVFMFTDGYVHVAALSCNKRPTAETKLYRAPIMNWSSDFSVCLGNISIPMNCSLENIPAWERFIFEGGKTHLSFDDVINKKHGFPLTLNITTNEGHIEFWKYLADQKIAKFPTKALERTYKTLGGLIGD